MNQPFKFPTPPEGHYFQIKSGMYSDYPSAPWRVVLMRKRWIFPVEVAGAELEHLTPEAVWEAAQQAHMNLSAQRVVRRINHLRKQLNREARRKNRT